MKYLMVKRLHNLINKTVNIQKKLKSRLCEEINLCFHPTNGDLQRDRKVTNKPPVE